MGIPADMVLNPYIILPRPISNSGFGLKKASTDNDIKAAKDHNLCLELLLKDISTVNNDPKRLWRWSEIALEETVNAVL